jgi:hypothetical protein
MFPSRHASSLFHAASLCLVAVLLSSCQTVKQASLADGPVQRSEVIYTGAPPCPHEFAFQARPPGCPHVPTPDGPGMECLHHLATSLSIAGRIPLALGAGAIMFGMSGYHVEAGVSAAGEILDQPLP